MLNVIRSPMRGKKGGVEACINIKPSIEKEKKATLAEKAVQKDAKKRLFRIKEIYSSRG